MKKDGTITIYGKDITINGSGEIVRQGQQEHDAQGAEDPPELRDEGDRGYDGPGFSRDRRRPNARSRKAPASSPIGRASPLAPRGDRRSDARPSRVDGFVGRGRNRDRGRAARHGFPPEATSRHAVRSHPARSSSGRSRGSTTPVEPLVRHPLDPSGRVVLARTTVPIVPEQVDREVVLAFESGDLGKPIVLGVLRRPDGQEPSEPRVAPPTVDPADRPGDPGRRATGPHRRERDRPALRQGEPHADPRREGPDPGDVPAEPLLGCQPHQGRVGPDQLGPARATASRRHGTDQRNRDAGGLHDGLAARRPGTAGRRGQGDLHDPQGPEARSRRSRRNRFPWSRPTSSPASRASRPRSTRATTPRASRAATSCSTAAPTPRAANRPSA